MFNVESNQNEISIEMSAELDNLDVADDAFTEFVQNKKVDVDLFSLRIIFRESTLNAVAHGSLKDPTKIVKIISQINEKHISLEVIDYGEGFDWASRIDKIDPMAESGRGLALMKIYSDKMSYNEIGNHIFLEKNFISVASEVCK